MTDPLSRISTLRTPQTQPADPRQVPNSAGGFTFEASRDALLHRFLTLGTAGGTYYVGEDELTAAAAGAVMEYARAHATDLVRRVVEVSAAGRAPRNQPALFALAAASALGDTAGRRAAFEALPMVARTGTHLFEFAGYRNQFGGWGRGMQRAIGNWYTHHSLADEEYQVVKYRQRGDWSHRRVLRHIHHPRPVDRFGRPRCGPTSHARYQLHEWIIGRDADLTELPLVQAFAQAQIATTAKEWCNLVEGGSGLSWEMLPDAALAEPAVWRALLQRGMPMTALLRQLPRLTRLDIFNDFAMIDLVRTQLTDPNRLRKARVHPVSVLLAARTYAGGRALAGSVYRKNSATWSPAARIMDALDEAFYAAYGAVESANKRTMLALDVSGSMTHPVGGMPISCREASAALALVTMATEFDAFTVGFSRGLTPLTISPRQRLDDAIRAISGLPFDRTDCALPMIGALAAGVEVDTFVIYTDNETWWGGIHPHQALLEYRQRTGIDARLAVVSLTATRFSIADPTDPGMLDVSGFDSAVPGLVSDFSAHRI